MLNDFIRLHDIDERAVARMRHRLFLVSRFNRRRTGCDPEVWLFTNQPISHLSTKYKDNFTGVGSLRYESFVECLTPTMAEVIERAGQSPSIGITTVRQQMPRRDAAEGSVVLDRFSYLFRRGISTTSQEALRKCRPLLPAELQDLGQPDAGRGVTWLLQRSLCAFSEFQPRTIEIIDAFSHLYHACSMQNGLPAYAIGSALPTGFPEKLIDFVYAEDARVSFRAEGIDFGALPWNEIQRDPNNARMFCNVVNAFRDALLETRRCQYMALRFNDRSLDDLARAAVDEFRNLSHDFARARDAYNGLRQMLCSKGLISTVLDWMLNAYYDIHDVRALGTSARDVHKDEAVKRAVLDRWAENNMAKPLAVAPLEERHRFSRELSENFELLLSALWRGGEEASKESLNKLPSEIQALAGRILAGDPERVRGIASMTKTEEALTKAFLVDIVCPTLFQQPVLSQDMLCEYFRREITSAYLAAVLLPNKTMDADRGFRCENPNGA